MTVKELIERLQKLPPELPVYVKDWNEEWMDDAELQTMAIKDADKHCNACLNSPDRGHAPDCKYRNMPFLPKRLTLME